MNCSNEESIIEKCENSDSINNTLLYHQLFFLNGILEKRNIRFNTNKNNIARGQGGIIAILKRKDNISTKDLADIFNISVTSLNENLKKLEQKGYIEKVPSKEDKRILLIRLTDEGKAIKFNKPKDIDIFDCLRDEEKLEFSKTLQKLTLELHRKLREEDPEKYEKMLEHRQKVLKKHFKCDKIEEEWFKIIEN